MPVFHKKSSRNHTQLLETKAFVEMPGMGIGSHHGIELKNPEAVGLSLDHTVQDKLLADMKPPCSGADRIACIGDVPAAAFVIGVQDIKSQNSLGRRSIQDTANCNAAEGLGGEKCRTGCIIQQI